MKILHVITSLKIGGAESALYNLLFQFKQDKQDQHYVAYFYDGPNVKKIKNLGIPVFKIKGLFFKYDPFAYFRLKKLVKRINPDVIHSSLWAANFLSKFIAQHLQIPIICDLHSNFLHDGKLRIFLERYFLFDVQKYVAVSTTVKEGFIGAIVEKVKKNKKIRFELCTIQNGIDVDVVRKKGFEQKLLRRDIGLDEKDFVFGSVGRLEPIKGYDLLIKSFAELMCKLQDRNIKLCIIGDGSQRPKLEKLVEKLNLFDQVVFLGQKDDAYAFYPLFDCFVLSSVSEGLSIALLEALCFSLPIISTCTNVNHDVIIDEVNGFLAPPGRAFELARAMEKLYVDSELRQRIESVNLGLVKSKFGIDRVKNFYQKFYEQVVAAKRQQF